MPTTAREDMIQHAMSLRLVSSFIIGLCVMLALTLVEAGVILLLNPLHLPGTFVSRVAALPGVVTHTPLLLLPPVELFGAWITVLLIERPIALFSYLRAVHNEQAEYHQLYTPLKALTNIRHAAEYQQDAASPVVTVEEQVSILDLIQQQHSHQLILGVPGAGKTMALRVYQYEVTARPLQLVRERGQIPVYVPMKNYSLFLKQQALLAPAGAPVEATEQGTILDFLSQSDLPGMVALRPHLGSLSKQGRLLFLCDGLNEVDSNYLTRVSEELVGWMRDTQNRLVMTCREVDYREQPDFVQLVEEGRVTCVTIYPLQPEQVSEFVERYVERQDQHWRHTAGQILQVIDRSRLRYHCTNPMMLFTLMGIIDKIGVERGKQIDTRGRLLREYVRQLIAYEQRQPRWNRLAPDGREVVRFLSEVACAARWANDRNAIQLRVSSPVVPGRKGVARMNFDELADELRFWLDEHPAQGPFEEDGPASAETYEDLPQLLQFAISAALIEISPGGVLSFRHELIAEYFVAEYFAMQEKQRQYQATTAIREELLENVGRWSEPVAIWAGLVDDPLALAERFGELGRSNPAYVLQSLALGLVCVGVLWAPPQAEVQRTVVLPASIEDALSIAVRNRAAREELARIFTRCAEEGGQEVYRSLLPLLMVDGVDELLVLLDQSLVPDMLFAQLLDAIDNVAYEAQVKRLTRVLGRFGAPVISRASQLCLPAPERSTRLRAAAVNILGGTHDARAVEPLVARLADTDMFIVERATNALIRLGPDLALNHVIQMLVERTVNPFLLRIHYAALLILGRFLDEQDVRRQLSLIQFQHVLEAVIPVLTSNYETEPEVQQLAREILVRQAQRTTGAGTLDHRWERVIEALVSYLPSENETAVRNVIQALQEIGEAATPRLLDLLDRATGAVRIRVLAIIKAVRDVRALPHLLRMVGDSSPVVEQHVTEALLLYIPECISGLIDLVLQSTDEKVAERAAAILRAIGAPAVEPVTQVLFKVVPGRTRLLVQMLEQTHDARTVPALTTLLRQPDLEPLLVVAVVRALSRFSDERAVPALLTLLESTNPQIYDEAAIALSQLGSLALSRLVAVLDVQEKAGQASPLTQRVRRAILGMVPFPGEQLIELLEGATEAQIRQVMEIFKAEGPDAALVLARHLLHPQPHLRDAIRLTLSEMPGALVVPALLETLRIPQLYPVASTLLLNYPDAAISPLVELLAEQERGDIAAQILPAFGSRVLRPLISGLDDQRGMARERAMHIVVTLVRQSEDTLSILREIVRLFSPSLPVRARDVLLRVLTSELADVSLPALLEGLEDAHMLDDVAEAFVLLSRRPAQQQQVLDRLIQALYNEHSRRGAEVALAHIGAPAVASVGELLTDPQPAVAQASREILRAIGVPALGYIWMAYSDTTHPTRREAARELFQSMHTDVIKDELIARLLSDEPDNVAMAVSLLLERIHDEAEKRYADREMIPVLIEYIQAHGVERTNLRVIAMLLLLDERLVINPLIQSLEEAPERHQQLLSVLWLLGEEAQQALLAVFADADVPARLRAEAAALLGMMAVPEGIEAEAQKLSEYGLALSAGRTGSLQAPERLTVALHALGGLLAGGYWDARRLQELRAASPAGSAVRELFSILLGWRYEPQFEKLRNELQKEREEHKKQAMELMARIVADQERIQELDRELEKEREEHGTQSDELKRALQDNEALRRELEQAVQEKGVQNTTIEQLIQERDSLLANFNQLLQEKNMLSARLDRALRERQVLEEQNERLIQQFNQPHAR
ncbi:MAG: HEAT repeat domain-containing protein [Ktedonobacteraceae bacterium]|nr:HEAT repeat domain-containing protein [Ktedonobacteraceae bacterium]